MTETNAQTAGRGAKEPDDIKRDTSRTVPGGPAQLTDRQRQILVRVLRVAYPHDDFPDGPYESTADAEQATHWLREYADEPYFRAIRGTAVVALYDDHEVWELLGYEGPSFDKGGYIDRGFDDLEWLPTPRIEEYDGEPRPDIIDDAQAQEEQA